MYHIKKNCSKYAFQSKIPRRIRSRCKKKKKKITDNSDNY